MHTHKQYPYVLVWLISLSTAFQASKWKLFIGCFNHSESFRSYHLEQNQPQDIRGCGELCHKMVSFFVLQFFWGALCLLKNVLTNIACVYSSWHLQWLLGLSLPGHHLLHLVFGRHSIPLKRFLQVLKFPERKSRPKKWKPYIDIFQCFVTRLVFSARLPQPSTPSFTSSWARASGKTSLSSCTACVCVTTTRTSQTLYRCVIQQCLPKWGRVPNWQRPWIAATIDNCVDDYQTSLAKWSNLVNRLIPTISHNTNYVWFSSHPIWIRINQDKP